MKTNAMVRIILYTLTIVLLVFLLCVGLGLREITLDLGYGNGTTVEGEATFDTSEIRNINIDWAAGSVTIRADETDCITVTEVLPEGCEHKMAYKVSGDTLKLSYSNGVIGIGFGNWSGPSKDLIITVPIGWVCEELQIDGAALKIELDGITVGNLELDGASCNLTFFGSAEEVEIDGAATKILMEFDNRVSEISVNGASCELDLTLPKDCGFQVEMDGLGCDFQSELSGISQNGSYTYGDQHCKIEVDGLGCKVSIQDHTSNMMSYSVRCGDDFTASLLLETLDEEYAPGTIVTLKTDILTDVDLELYINGEFVCSQTEVVSPDGSNYWEFQFTMRNEPVVIHFKTVDGILR